MIEERGMGARLPRLRTGCLFFRFHIHFSLLAFFHGAAAPRGSRLSFTFWLLSPAAVAAAAATDAAAAATGAAAAAAAGAAVSSPSTSSSSSSASTSASSSSAASSSSSSSSNSSSLSNRLSLLECRGRKDASRRRRGGRFLRLLQQRAQILTVRRPFPHNPPFNTTTPPPSSLPPTPPPRRLLLPGAGVHRRVKAGMCVVTPPPRGLDSMECVVSLVGVELRRLLPDTSPRPPPPP